MTGVQTCALPIFWAAIWCPSSSTKEARVGTTRIGNEKLIEEQVLDYIKCMTLNDVDPVVYSHLSMDNVKQIREYIEDSMTATTFVESEGSSPARNVITSELVYYWMVALQIPFECQHWHLHRLLTLIRVCNVKNQPDKKSVLLLLN